ncbi:deoxyribose-phosphate aldolase [[Clostridium] spiroforme]|nr:deoxyribose-phosphate aldolase [Thomasclavelia spiroformis]MBM6880795.1 deoxyribose-phosphate aldolase [Thomasclavelia spiroformis]
MPINKLIDHTLLKADATKAEVTQVLAEALKYDFASVCIQPCHVSYAAQYLKGSDVKVCTVIGFPLGANTSAVKAFETADAIQNGADEIDMVINIGALKDGQDETVLNDIVAVVQAAQDKTVKVILETCLLSEEEIVKACQLCMQAKADFVKTSTGFSTGGATIENVRIMKTAIDDPMQVKAAGGIRTYEDLIKMVEAGASRIGTSAGCSIMQKKGDC